MVKSTLERQQKLRRQRKRLGWKRKEFFVTESEYQRLKDYLRSIRAPLANAYADNQSGDGK